MDDLEKPVAIVAGIFYIVLEGIPKLWRLVVKDKPKEGVEDASIPAGNNKNFKLGSIIQAMKPICVVVFIIAGLMWLFNTDNKLATTQGKLSILQENAYQDVAPTNIISDETYENERVYVDGNVYKHCTFKSVTLVFQGKKPCGFIYCVFGQFDVATETPQASQVMIFLNGAGFLNTNKVNFESHVEPPERSTGND